MSMQGSYRRRVSLETKLHVLSWIISGVLALFLGRSCENAKELQGLNESLADTLTFTKDEKMRQTASIQVLTLDNEKALKQIKSKDSTIQWLQSTVADYKGKVNTAIVLSNTTTSTGGAVTSVIWDTVYVDSFVYLNPVYSASWNNRWEVGNIRATKDSIFRDITFKNEYEIIQGTPRNGWFKKNEYTIQVKNMNPNTSTDELRSFNIQTTPKKFNLGIQAGYGIDLLNLRPVPYVGFGIQYRIMGIK